MGQALSDYYSPSAPTNEIIVPEIAPEQSPNLFVIAAFTRNDNTGDKHTALTPSHFIPAAEAIIKPEELASYTLDYIDVEMPKFSFSLTAAQIPSKWLTDPVRRIDHENEVFKLQAEVDHAGNEKDKTSQQLLSMQKESNARFAQLLAEMSAMRGEMTDLRGEVTDLQDKVTRREKEITRLQKQVDDLLTRLSQEEARSTDLADQVADLNATIVAMAAELDVAGADIATLDKIRLRHMLTLTQDRLARTACLQPTAPDCSTAWRSALPAQASVKERLATAKHLLTDRNGVVIPESVKAFAQSADGMKFVVDKSPSMRIEGNKAAHPPTLPPREMYEQVVERNSLPKSSWRRGWNAMISLIYAPAS